MTELLGATFPVILAAPSGAGKTTIARMLGERRADIEFSVSATTRPPRPHEIDGRDYHFRSADEFRAMIDAGELIEWAEVHGHLYGTPAGNLGAARRADRYLILDIDVQGSRQVRRTVPEAVGIFILPPSGAELAARLRGRGSESESVRRGRLLTARSEVAAAVEFDYVIVNDELERAVSRVESILAAEAARPRRVPDLHERLQKIRAEIDHSASGEEVPKPE